MKTNISHLHQLKGKAFVKDAVDLRSAGQVGGVHLISRPFDALLKVHAKLLHHPADCTQYTEQLCCNEYLCASASVSASA